MSEYIITDEQLQADHEQFYEAGQRNRQVWTTRVYHGQEIVRCRDCKSVSIDEFGGGWCNENCREVKPWDFCAWGERREA